MENTNTFYATGKRKSSIAKVWITPGKGKFIVNNKNMDEYFVQDSVQSMLTAPLTLVEKKDAFDIKITVLGGGVSGQAGAITLGLSRALLLVDSDLRGILKDYGYLTRDSRMKERKKYGKKGARASFQFSKR
ncbi:MAG: 30S ribosomal protein S9 [Desulfobacteraceae bacterium]|nr:30S ribosomal protein S9 [Desulfobacteraceae bacterium]